MDYTDYYETIKPDEVINPNDLLKTFSDLVAKAESLDKSEAPRMLTSLMLSLALEIEINRRNALIIINPENPEPMTLSIVARGIREKKERTKIIKALKSAGWAIKSINGDNLIELSVAKFELTIV